MLIDNQLWYARVGLYNINDNCRFLLRTLHNTIKIFYDSSIIFYEFTLFFIIEMFIVFVFTWSVHYDKAHFLNRKNLSNSQTSIFTCLYWSTSQNCDQFSDFRKDFSILLNNIDNHRPS